jgi:hypothetical protein
MAGRPLELSPAMIELVCSRMKVIGATVEEVAASCDIDDSTIHRWQKRGREDIEAGRETLHGDFFRKLQRARAERRLAAMADIRVQGKDDWRAVRWLLQVEDPVRFAENATRMHVTEDYSRAIDRLKRTFADDPRSLERALAAIAGDAGEDRADEDEGGEG